MHLFFKLLIIITCTALMPACDFFARNNINDPGAPGFVVDTNASLSSIHLTAGNLVPDFNEDITEYGTIVSSTTETVMVRPTAAGYPKSISVNSLPVSSGEYSTPIGLSEGHNSIEIILIADDSVTTKIYNIDVVRSAPESDNAYLSALSLSGESLDQVFDKDTTGYTSTIAFRSETIRVTAAAEEYGASIRVNGLQVATGIPSNPIDMSVGENIITVRVTATDGFTYKEYNIVVTRRRCAELSGLSVSAGTLGPDFDNLLTEYLAVSSSGTASVTVTPTAADPTGSITVNGSPVASGGTSSAIALTAGTKTDISIVVTATDSSVETYTITAVRPLIDLPRSGQTTRYRDYDDGDLEPGAAWPSSRFTDNGNNTITDTLTGLMWEKNPGGGNDGNQTAAELSWEGSLSYASALTLGSHTDWRLPNINELAGLVNYEENDLEEWLESKGFSIPNGILSIWSSTTYAKDTDQAWIMRQDNSVLQHFDKINSFFYATWAVRDDSSVTPVAETAATGQTTQYISGDDGDLERGITWPSPRFYAPGDGTIIDYLTGLVWQKEPLSDLQYWTDTLDYAEDSTLGGYSDWRIPNFPELRSLFNYEETAGDTWLNNQGFDGVGSDYWTSTSYAPYQPATRAWHFYIYNDSSYSSGSSTKASVDGRKIPWMVR